MYEEKRNGGDWMFISSADVAHVSHLNIGTQYNTHTQHCLSFSPPIADTVQSTSVNLNYICK